MVPRVAFMLVLGALAAVFITAAAAQGWFHRLPPQPYFPPQFAEARAMPCDPEGDPWPDRPHAAPRLERLIGESEADWYGLHLRAAQERSLWRPPGESGGRTFRFLWLRSFHAPAVLRIDERDPGQFWLTATLLQGQGGYDPGMIDRRVVRALTKEEAAAYQRAYSRVAGLPQIGCGRGVDGSTWVFETREQGRYSLLKRWTPASGAFHDLGVLLIGFTGWKPEPLY